MFSEVSVRLSTGGGGGEGAGTCCPGPNLGEGEGEGWVHPIHVLSGAGETNDILTASPVG